MLRLTSTGIFFIFVVFDLLRFSGSVSQAIADKNMDTKKIHRNVILLRLSLINGIATHLLAFFFSFFRFNFKFISKSNWTKLLVEHSKQNTESYQLTRKKKKILLFFFIEYERQHILMHKKVPIRLLFTILIIIYFKFSFIDLFFPSFFYWFRWIQCSMQFLFIYYYTCACVKWNAWLDFSRKMFDRRKMK